MKVKRNFWKEINLNFEIHTPGLNFEAKNIKSA